MTKKKKPTPRMKKVLENRKRMHPELATPRNNMVSKQLPKNNSVKKQLPKDKLLNIIDAKESPIVQYTQNQTGNKEALVNKELFKAEKDVDVRTDVQWREITLVNSILAMNEMFKRNNLKDFADIQDDYIQKYLRLKISLDRKSRAEFVAVNRQQNNIDDATALLGNLSSINQTKK